MAGLIRLPQVLQLVSVSRSQLYNMMNADKFPKPIKIGERVSAWPHEEVEAWIANLIASQRQANN